MRFSTRPSPAMVVAVCALVFAMVGSAVAGTDGLSSKITKAKVKSIAKKQISKAEPGLSVANAATATKALSADNGDDRPTRRPTRPTRPTPTNAVTSASTPTNAVNAENADTADNATNADNADNADALGGLAANNYVRRFFAKVAYTANPPTIISGSPGVTSGGEGALGFPRINFPQSMNNCAVSRNDLATLQEPRSFAIRRAVSGTQVQLAIQDGANAAVRPRTSASSASVSCPSLIRLLWAAARPPIGGRSGPRRSLASPG